MIKKNFLILFFIFLACCGQARGYDESLVYHFSYLGNLNFYPVPFALLDFSLTEKSNVTINYIVEWCIWYNDIYLYILATPINIPCSASWVGSYSLVVGQGVLDAGIYTLVYGSHSTTPVVITDIDILITYDDGFGSAIGTTYDENYKNVWFFENYDEFIEFAEETTIAYMIALIIAMLFVFWQIIFISLN